MLRVLFGELMQYSLIVILLGVDQTQQVAVRMCRPLIAWKPSPNGIEERGLGVSQDRWPLFDPRHTHVFISTVYVDHALFRLHEHHTSVQIILLLVESYLWRA